MSLPENRDPAIESQISNKTTIALVCGIVGLIFSGMCCGLVSIYAILEANRGDGLIDVNGYGEEYRFQLRVSRILGWIGVVIWVAQILFAMLTR